MIYLIGGPPKCGKTTLAKRLSKQKGIPWVSTDTLQCVIKPYMKRKFPSSSQSCRSNDEKYSRYSRNEIIEAYQQQAKISYQAIDMFTICEITDKNDFIIEGYHIEPELVSELNMKYPNKIKSVFLIKSDEIKFVNDIAKSTTPNDWIITRTDNKNTYKKIAKMICEYGKIFKKNSKKYGFTVLNMDSNFNNQVDKGINILMSR